MSTNKPTREVTIEDAELLAELEAKNKEVEKGRKVNRKITEYQKQLNQIGHKVQQYKDKIVPMFNERIKPQIELGEFEEVTTVDKSKDSKIKITIVDQVEEFKEKLKEQREKQKDNQDETDVKQDKDD